MLGGSFRPVLRFIRASASIRLEMAFPWRYGFRTADFVRRQLDCIERWMKMTTAPSVCSDTVTPLATQVNSTPMPLPRDFEKRRRYETRGRRKSLKRLRQSRGESSRGSPVRSIKAPKVLSILGAPQVTGAFFDSLQRYVQCHRALKVDLGQVEEVSLDALAYLLAIARDHSARCGLRGTFPRLPEAMEFVQKSGFLTYLSSNVDQLQPEDDTYGIYRGSLADPLIAERLVLFVQKHLSIPCDTAMTKAVYTVLIECMANTCNHAFRRGKMLPIRHWYVMARYRRSSHCVEFAFLDSGLGIPATIRRNFMDKLRQIARNGDADLIASALAGAFRTRTRLRERGKGLPRIQANVAKGHLSDLRIQSLKGCVVITGNAPPDLSTSNWGLRGTLLTWKVSSTLLS